MVNVADTRSLERRDFHLRGPAASSVSRYAVVASLVTFALSCPWFAEAKESHGGCVTELAALAPDAMQTESPIQAVAIAHAVETDSEALRFPVQVPGRTVLELPCGSWELRLEAEGYWSESKATTSSEDAQGLTVHLLPAGEITGRLSPPRGDKPPSSVEARFTALTVEKSSPEDTLREGVAPCLVDDLAIVCSLPAGQADVRIHAPPYAPIYLWGFRLKAGNTKALGPLRLVPGASLVGWVTDVDGRSQEGAEVRLRPPDAPHPALLEDEGEFVDLQRSKLFTAESNERGFFQLLGLEEGTYDLRARKEAFAEATYSQPVELAANLETVLPDPLVLQPAAVLELVIDPPLDVWGRPWDVRLLPAVQTLEKPGHIMNPGDDGSYRLEGVDPGSYGLRIRSSREETWRSESFEIPAGSSTRFVHLLLVEVTGTVELGGEPFPGRIGFRGFTTSTIALPIDGEGEFSGFLPSEGLYGIEVSPEDDPLQVISVKTETIEAGPSGVAKLTITLPDTIIEGEVVDSAGNAVPEARVMATPQTVNPADILEKDGRKRRLRSPTHRTGTDADGTFQFRGLEPGEYELRATDKYTQTSSLSELVHLNEGMEPPRLRLVLRDERTVSGLVWANGGPVAGAVLTTWPDLVTAPDKIFAPQTHMSDVDGSFIFTLPEDVDWVSVMAYISGYGLTLKRERIPDDGALVLYLEKAAGRLVLDIPAYRSGDPPRGYVVLHDGAVFPCEILRASLNKYQASAIELEAVAPGVYSFCEAQPTLSALTQNKDPFEFCTTGSLTVGGELVLPVKVQEGRGVTP